MFDDENTARLWEISENLHRKDLTVDERSDQIAEWISLTESTLQPGQLAPIETKRIDGRGHRPESGISAASRELGTNRMDAHRAAGQSALDCLMKKLKAPMAPFSFYPVISIP